MIINQRWLAEGEEVKARVVLRLMNQHKVMNRGIVIVPVMNRKSII